MRMRELKLKMCGRLDGRPLMEEINATFVFERVVHAELSAPSCDGHHELNATAALQCYRSFRKWPIRITEEINATHDYISELSLVSLDLLL